ncbi:MAG TPA: DUF488 domain-containing protein [Candidatus Acidoferrum sp.]|nr:DUF488 domain-containing protein [Candidatus Acidoferrum sp.]
MKKMLFTIGFAGKTAQEFFGLLQSAGVNSIVDIRQHREGQLAGFAKHPDLQFLLKNIAGIDYQYEPSLAPTPELLKKYRESKDWPVYEREFLELLSSRGVPHSLDTSTWPDRIALLCSEPGPEKCHRRLVAELLAEYWRQGGKEIEILHLVAERPKASSPLRKRRRASHD